MAQARGPHSAPTGDSQTRQHPIGLVQRSDVDDAQHRVEDDAGSVGAEGARHLVAAPQEHDRGKSSLKRDLRPCAGFGDDGEERGLAIVDQAPVGRERRERGLRRRVRGRSEESEHDRAAGKGIEGQPMAPELRRKALSPGWAPGLSAKSSCSDIDFRRWRRRSPETGARRR